MDFRLDLIDEIGLKEEAKKMKLTYSKWRKPIEGIELINVDIPSKRGEVRNQLIEMIRRRTEKKKKKEIRPMKYEFDVNVSEESETDSRTPK